MITTLEELTMAQFIDLVCGDTSVVVGKREVVPSKKIVSTIRNIVFEYRGIADRTGVRSFLGENSSLIKAKKDSILFTICHNLVQMGLYDQAREVLTNYGIRANSMSDQRVSAEVKSRQARAKSMVAKLEKDEQEGDVDTSQVRDSFNAQTAMLMGHFKFQIDTSTMKATLYAHLVDRYNQEIQAQLKALKK